MGFLMYSWIFLPLLTAGEVPRPCVLPFVYQRKSYSSCTDVASENKKLWCATTANYDTHPQWKYCALAEYGGNTGGQPCVFPFTYKGRTFYSCTNEDAQIGRFWCATTGSYDKDKKWSYCADTRLHANQIGPCVFPFIFNGKSYSSCTTAGASTGKLWCSLTSNYDKNPKWTYCDPSEPRPCHFPFVFNGKSYSACTKDGARDGQLWCATTADYAKDSKWRACALQEYEGSSKGQACVFPFIYKSRTFYTCISEDTEYGRLWCATTGNYDKDKKWSYCADTDFSPCTFPFVYKNKKYSTCTKEGSKFNWLWCATTDSYDKDHKWKRCYEKEHGGNSHGKPCVFPFTYRNRKFYTCTDERSRPRMFWCATTSNYDIEKKWTYCADTILVGKRSSDVDQEKTYCDSSDPRCLMVSRSLEEVSCMKLTNVQETGYGEYGQEGDQGITDLRTQA